MIDVKEKIVLSSKDAAIYLGISPGTLRQWRHTKRVDIPFLRMGRNCKYLLDDLNEFLEKCKEISKL